MAQNQKALTVQIKLSRACYGRGLLVELDRTLVDSLIKEGRYWQRQDTCCVGSTVGCFGGNPRTGARVVVVPCYCRLMVVFCWLL